MIITGILVIKVGVGSDPVYERILGYMFITFGILNLSILLIRKNGGDKRRDG